MNRKKPPFISIVLTLIILISPFFTVSIFAESLVNNDTEANITEIDLYPDSFEVAIGDVSSFEVEVIAIYGEGTTRDVSPDVQFESSDPSIVSIEKEVVTILEGGTIRIETFLYLEALGSGEVTITATYEGHQDTASVIVNVPVERIAFNYDSLYYFLEPNTTSQIQLLAYYRDGSTIDITDEAEFTTSSQAIVEITDTGELIGKREGKATISAKWNERYYTNIYVFVNSNDREIDLMYKDFYISAGTSINLTAQMISSDGSILYLEDLATYESMNPEVATIDSLGNVTGISPGAANIKVTYQDIEAYATVRVSANSFTGVYYLTSISIDPDEINVQKQEGAIFEKQLQITAYYSGGSKGYFNVDVTTDAFYESSNSEVVTVSPEGKLTILGDGQAEVYVILSDKIKAINVQVNPQTAVTDLALSKSELTLSLNTPPKDFNRAEAARFLVRSLGYYDENATSNFFDVPPDHEYYRDISSAYTAGIMNGYSDGTFGPDNLVTRAEFAKLIVSALRYPAVEDISLIIADVPSNYWSKPYIDTAVNSGLMTLFDDEFRPNEYMDFDVNAQLIPIITPFDATNKRVIWSSSNPKMATVNSIGTVTAISEGQTIITARTEDGGIERTTTVTVITMEPPPYNPDLNGDGEVDLFDIVQAAKYAPEKLPFIILYYGQKQ